MQTKFIICCLIAGCAGCSESSSPIDKVQDTSSDISKSDGNGSSATEDRFQTFTDAEGKVWRFDARHSEANTAYCEASADCAYITDIGIPTNYRSCDASGDACIAPVCPVAYRYSKGTLLADTAQRAKLACRKLTDLRCIKNECFAVDRVHNAVMSSFCVTANDCVLESAPKLFGCSRGGCMPGERTENCEIYPLCRALYKHAEQQLLIREAPQVMCTPPLPCREVASKDIQCIHNSCAILDPLHAAEWDCAVEPLGPSLCTSSDRINPGCYQSCQEKEDCITPCEVLYSYGKRALEIRQETCDKPKYCLPPKSIACGQSTHACEGSYQNFCDENEGGEDCHSSDQINASCYRSCLGKPSCTNPCDVFFRFTTKAAQLASQMCEKPAYCLPPKTVTCRNKHCEGIFK